MHFIASNNVIYAKFNLRIGTPYLNKSANTAF